MTPHSILILTWTSSKDTVGNNFRGVKEIIPLNMSILIGREFMSRAYVGVNFTEDSLIRQSRIGFVIFSNDAPITRHLRRSHLWKPVLLAMNLWI